MKQVLLTLLFFTIIHSPIQSQEKNLLINSGEIIATALKLHDEGKYKEAITEYKKVTRSDTNYVWALYELSLSLSADSQHNEAIRYTQEALQLPNGREHEPGLYTQYASLIDITGNPERSLQIFDSAIAKYPAYSPLYLNKGITLMKMKRLEEAEKIFQQALLIDPYAASTHYRLGQVAIQQGKIIPAFLSFTAYMMISPAGAHHRNAIILLGSISKNSDEIHEYLQSRKQEPAEAFKLIEEIVLSKIALDKNYKPIIKLDDQVSRQMQVIFEKIEHSDSDNDFWIQYYVPLFKNLFNAGRFEHFVNWIFSNIDIESIQNYNKKNKKEIEKLTADIVTYLNNIRASRQLNFAKRSAAKEVYLHEDGKLTGKGSYTGDQFTGNWEFYYPAGNLRSKGMFNSKGNKEGLWQFYYYNGKLRGKESYVDDKLNGEATFYFSNGNISSQSMYKNGEAEGINTVYYLVGTPSYTETYKYGKLEGEKKQFYSNGTIHTITTYTADSLNGPYKSYYQNGAVEATAQYVNGQLHGPSRGYHKNGKPSFEGDYQNSEAHGVWKRYDESGKLKNIENYSNGLLEGEYSEFYKNGQLFTKYIAKAGNAVGDVSYYDDDGKLFAIMAFDKNIIRSAKYFDKTGKQISISELKSKKLDLISYRPDGTKRSQLLYDEKGNATGKETLFYRSGKVSETNIYENGQLNGTSIGYYLNGNKSEEIPYVNGLKDGLYKGHYSHGKLQSEGWYKENMAEGTWMNYDEFGNTISISNYYNNELHGYNEEFYPTGKKLSETKNIYGWIESFTQFDTTGKVLYSAKFPAGSGKFTSLHFNGKPYAEGNYVKGSFDGPYRFYFFDGSIEAVQYYKRGLLDSIYRNYYYGGKISIEGQYKMGDKTGVWKYYGINGKLYYTEQYSENELQGKKIYYHETGKPDTELDYEDDVREGWVKKYDAEGTLMYQLKYKDNLPVAYTYPDKAGKLVPEIALPGSAGKVKTYYQNGNVSSEFEYIDGKVHGEDKLYYSSGKLWITNTENFGVSEGAYTEYFPNGEIKLSYNYLHGKTNGPYKKFDDKGILREEGYLYNGEHHQTVKYYDDMGKLKETHVYYYGKLLSVKK